jgi:hypothetical protein
MKTKDKVYGAAESIKPYVDRAMTDEQLREDLLRAFGSARQIYKELMGDRSPVTIASRVATDDDIRDRLRDAIEDLRRASDRIQGRHERSARARTLLLVGIALGVLFNPVTGPETRRFIRDLFSSGSQNSEGTSSNGRGQ